MTRLRKIIIAAVVLLSSATISYGGIITGSRTGAISERVGTITGSRTGTITGSRVGTITGSSAESRGTILGNIHTEILLRLMSILLSGGFEQI